MLSLWFWLLSVLGQSTPVDILSCHAVIMILTVVCFRSKYTSRYFVLPCCHYDFDCKFSGKQQGLSNYRTYLNFVKEIGEVCGFKVEEDTLRIPSTKRVSDTVLSTYNVIGSDWWGVVILINATHFQPYFSYIVVVSFISGGNRSTQRKPQTCFKSLTNFIT